MHNAVRLAQEPIRADNSELDDEEQAIRKTLIKFESRKNFDKQEDDHKFFEQEKQKKINAVLQNDKFRHLNITNDGVNQSYISAGDRNPLEAFRIDLKAKKQEDYVMPATQILPSTIDPESARRDISKAYAQPASKISALSGFMVK